MRPNPFHPAFGAQPPVLIGRDDVLRDVRDGLLEGPGSEYRVNKVVGARGVGKTVLLEAAADLARQEGWVALNVTSSPGMLEEILDLAIDRTSHLSNAARRALTSLGVGPLKVGLESPHPPRQPGWRIQMERVLDILESHGTGLFFSVDEVSAKHDAMQTFGKVFQHFQREGRNVALLAAGLPLNVQAFEQLPDTSFIRRAIPHTLANVPLSEVRRAMRQTFVEHGRIVDREVLRVIGDATEGYPFLIQLVGAQVWRRSSSDLITLQDAESGIAAARDRIGDTVLSSSIADISPNARIFLLNMVNDDGPSRMKDITARSGWSSAQSNVYRSRLITAGMIRSAGHGLVEFAFPYLRDYLREHAEEIVWAEDA